jgi:hypothetical protein
LSGITSGGLVDVNFVGNARRFGRESRSTTRSTLKQFRRRRLCRDVDRRAAPFPKYRGSFTGFRLSAPLKRNFRRDVREIKSRDLRKTLKLKRREATLVNEGFNGVASKIFNDVVKAARETRTRSSKVGKLGAIDEIEFLEDGEIWREKGLRKTTRFFAQRKTRRFSARGS